MPGLIVSLTKTFLEAHIQEFILIDRATIGELWGESNFLADFPGKWDVSCIALKDNRLTGFLIGSEKKGGYHIHRLAVDTALQRQGYGRQLIYFLIEKAKKKKVTLLTLKVSVTNKGAIDFYSGMDFIISRQDGVNFQMELNLI